MSDENSTPIASTEKRYDARYKSDTSGNTNYTEQYKNRTNLNTQATIVRSLTQHLREYGGDEISILDFGAGEGRTWFSTTHFMAEAGAKVKYYALDISGEGLTTFQNRLLQNGFNRMGGRDISQEALTEDNPVYLGSTLKKEGIGKFGGSAEIILAHSALSAKPEDIKKIIPEVDVTLCIFGVLSHIPGQENRQNFLRMFREITADDVMLTLPNAKRSHTDALAFYTLQRKNGTPIGLAKEDGDLYYVSGADRSAKDFYHVYRLPEIKEDFEAAGYRTPPIIGVSKTLKEEQLTDPTQPEIRRDNAFASRDKDEKGDVYVEAYATYFMVTGKGDREKQKSPSGLSDIRRQMNIAEGLWL